MKVCVHVTLGATGIVCSKFISQIAFLGIQQGGRGGHAHGGPLRGGGGGPRPWGAPGGPPPPPPIPALPARDMHSNARQQPADVPKQGQRASVLTPDLTLCHDTFESQEEALRTAILVGPDGPVAYQAQAAKQC